jgi:hypothetical protein
LLASVCGFGKFCFSFDKQVSESVCFGSVKIGFCLFDVLAKRGFHSASESLSQFCFCWSKFLIIWRFEKLCFLSIAKD